MLLHHGKVLVNLPWKKNQVMQNNIIQIMNFKFIRDNVTLTWLGLGPHLFDKVPRPGDSKVTFAVFKSNCHLLLTSLTTHW